MPDTPSQIPPAQYSSEDINQQVLFSLERALTELRSHKPNDRSEKDRYWAIVITDIEKAIAVFRTYII